MHNLFIFADASRNEKACDESNKAEAVVTCAGLVGSEFGVVNEENVENVVLAVARDVLNDLSSIFERTNHDDMKNAGVVIF